MQRMTQAELLAAVDLAIGKVRPPVSPEDYEAVVALVQGMEGMAQGLAGALASGQACGRVENGIGIGIGKDNGG